MKNFTGIKVFSATKHRDRVELGESITRWVRYSHVTIVGAHVVQSSDETHHCMSVVVYYR